MGIGNPLAEDPCIDLEDRVLVLRAKSGDHDALEELVGRHQAWITTSPSAQGLAPRGVP